MSLWDLTRLLAPKQCLNCQEAAEASLCEHCLGALEPIAGRGCRICGNPKVHRQASECDWCNRLGHLPQHCCTLYAYRKVGRELYQRLKFQGYWRLAQPLFDERPAEFFRAVPFLDYDCLVPIPESLSRKWTRHFNPAAMIAEHISRRCGLPVSTRLRLRAFSRHQVGLDYQQRRKNARGRFKVIGRRPLGSVILVDDVMTTGATLEAATQSLRRAGASRVAWFTLFRTL